MRKLLVRLGCSFHKASAFLFKADHGKQEEFVAEYEQDKQKVQDEGWRRYFIDGVHPLYGLEVVFYCWLLAGQRFEGEFLEHRALGFVAEGDTLELHAAAHLS